MKIEGKDRLVLLYTFGFAIDLFGLMILYNFLGIQKDFYLPIKNYVGDISMYTGYISKWFLSISFFRFLSSFIARCAVEDNKIKLQKFFNIIAILLHIVLVIYVLCFLYLFIF